MPDYAHFDGSPFDPWEGGHEDFRFDAWRVGMNLADIAAARDRAEGLAKRLQDEEKLGTWILRAQES